MALAPNNSLVRDFNALLRKEKAPSGRVPNDWHFDIRYVQIEPTPSHVLVLINPRSQFIHMERLPLGLPSNESGLAFFPESGKEAAPEVAKALLHSFVNKFGQERFMGNKAPAAFRPWKLTTPDRDLATEVGKEFKRLGVSPDELHKVGVSGKSVNDIMDDAFEKLFVQVKATIGLNEISRAVIKTPQCIGFSNFKLRPPMSLRGLGDETSSERRYNDALEYIQYLMNARPPKGPDVDTKAMLQQQSQEMHWVLQLVEEKPANVVKAEADEGDPKAAFDYGLRLLIGLDCKEDRTLARDYLVKAAIAPDASDELKATAHGILLDWYVRWCLHDFRARYLFAACHHANLAAKYCKLVSPKKAHASPCVLSFMSRVFEPQSQDCMELYLWYKDAVAAMEYRNQQYANEARRSEQKRLQTPNRYRCAAVGCGIEADSGRMLMKCAGKCDADKKPHYCSKECQKADWKNHKPFCNPGMPCSVIDPDTPTILGSGAAGPSSRQGSIQIPITHADGSTHVVSSSTLDPQMLREIRDQARNHNLGGGVGLPSNLHVERIEI